MYPAEIFQVEDRELAEFLKKAKPRTSRALLDLIVWCWGMMILGIVPYLLMQNIWTFLVAFAFVTSRMGALLALAHDAQHAAFLPDKRWNDLIAAWFCAYPVGSIFGSSRSVHMAHHKLLGQSDDPDRNFHLEANKSTPKEFVVHFTRLVFGGQLWTSIIVNGLLRPMKRDKKDAQTVILARTGHPEILNLVPVQLVIWAALWLASGQFWLYFALWLLPIFTTGTFLGFLRGFVDHARLKDDPQGPMEGRLISVLNVGLLARWYLAPFDFKYHAEHHLFPAAPHYYLEELHEILQKNSEIRKLYICRHSYAEFLGKYWHQIRYQTASVSKQG
ncbi:MAG: fatty acid desaturase [Candidatus Melainabacteria bacterium]|nr:fatty acid desaturase [Candidatus Melainabacteria bacterium]